MSEDQTESHLEVQRERIGDAEINDQPLVQRVEYR